MSDYEKAMADRAARIDALRRKIAGALPEELIGGFSLNGLTLEIGCGHGHFLAANAASAQGTDAADGNAGMEVGENGNPGTVLERARRYSR